MNDDIVKISIPYSNTVWGECIIQCKKDSDISREAFVEGITKGTIDAWELSVGDEEWVDYDSDDPQMSYEEAEELITITETPMTNYAEDPDYLRADFIDEIKRILRIPFDQWQREYPLHMSVRKSLYPGPAYEASKTFYDYLRSSTSEEEDIQNQCVRIEERIRTLHGEINKLHYELLLLASSK